MSSADKKSKMMLLEAAKLENEKENISKSKNMLQRKHAALKDRKSMHDLTDFSDDASYKRLRKKLIMYQDQIDLLENQNKVLQRKLMKRDRFANDYNENSESDRKNTKYLISDLRSKVIELQNRNKLLTKLIKRHKNVGDAYNSISDLKMAKKLITKLIINNDELTARINVLETQLKRLKDLGNEYNTRLYKEFDDEEEEDGDGDKDGDGGDTKEIKRMDFNFESMDGGEMNQIYESMKSKIAELQLQNESMEQQLQSTENELLQFESYANEWDAKHRSTEHRSKALYAKLNVSNEKLQNKLDAVYTKLEKEKAAALTWQNTIEDKLANGGDDDDDANDEKLILINQLREENKKLKTELGFMDEGDIKGHKAIAMDINEQFGTGLFNNLQYILMDADLNNDEMLKLKIKDKNDELYNVVLIKANGAHDDDDNDNEANEIRMDDILKPITFEQKNMVNRMEDIIKISHDSDDRIARMIQILGDIKKSKKVMVKTAHFPSTSLMSNNSSKINEFLAQDRQNKTMIKFAQTNRRNDSLESLDSLYDLSHDDAMAKFGVSTVKFENLLTFLLLLASCKQFAFYNNEFAFCSTQ